MGLRQKFFVLAGLSGLLMAIISIIGYFNAYSNLETSVERELTATIDAQGKALDGWISSKSSIVTGTADLLTALNGNEQVSHMIDILSLGDSDSDVLDLGYGDEKGFIQARHAGNKTGEIDPRVRPWYNDGKSAGKTVITEAYVDKFTGKLVVSAVSPFKTNGQFGGTIYMDITLDALDGEISKLKYGGEGQGVIFEKSGNILATSGSSKKMTSIRDVEGIGGHVDEMLQKGQGYFILEAAGDRDESVFAYTTVPSTGWIVGIAVPYDFVFAAVNKLRVTYAVLTIVGLILVVVMCLKFAASITGPVTKLEANAVQLSEGNLRLEDVPVTSSDEIGTLTAAFNKMSTNLRGLIKQMATTSEQVAASSEELTANAQQSADASVHVAETVGEVSEGMEKQLNDIDGAKKNVDSVFSDITAMSEKAELVTSTSVKASEAAQRGSALMADAIAKMGNIEKSVMASAEVVKKLGENSQQIGQIVEAISSIAEQTNLLSLNAAIEAARAGEHGRGFAVVADEVRKLAAESQTSAEKIKERISSIQDDTEHAVDSMQSGTAEVQNGTAAIREVGEQFKDILNMVNGIKQQMEEINTSVQTVSQGASHIVEAVDSIDTVSRRTAENTQSISASTEEQSASNEEIAAASHSLAQLASDMQGAIGKFKV